MRISFEQIHCGHHHARRADAALCPTTIDEGLLDRVQLIAVRYSFDRFDGSTLYLRHRNQTAVHNPAIDRDGTRAAFAFAATFLGSGQVQLLSQNVKQTLHWMRLQSSLLAVNGAADQFSGVSSWHVVMLQRLRVLAIGSALAAD